MTKNNSTASVATANIAAAAAKGTRRTNDTNRTAPTVYVEAPAAGIASTTTRPAAPSTVTVDDLRSAIAAVDSATTYSAAAAGTLQGAIHARYLHHAARFTRSVDGTPVVLESDRRRVQGLVFMDAVESDKLPKAAERTPAQKSLAQYVSRFGTVATNLDYGMGRIATVEDANVAYSAISEDKRDVATKLADAAFDRWLLDLLPADRAAFETVFSIMGREGADEFRAAAARRINPPKN